MEQRVALNSLVAALVSERERLGLSIAELARRIDEPRKTLSRWEKGERKMPIDVSEKYAEAVGLDMAVVLAPKGTVTNPELVELIREVNNALLAVDLPRARVVAQMVNALVDES
jgi:transcriptional regulator with XRE-family HTH domain